MRCAAEMIERGHAGLSWVGANMCAEEGPHFFFRCFAVRFSIAGLSQRVHHITITQCIRLDTLGLEANQKLDRTSSRTLPSGEKKTRKDNPSTVRSIVYKKWSGLYCEVVGVVAPITRLTRPL